MMMSCPYVGRCFRETYYRVALLLCFGGLLEACQAADGMRCGRMPQRMRDSDAGELRTVQNDFGDRAALWEEIVGLPSFPTQS